jgi:TRAP-type C4-dicarboxylate transport system permease small subunit
MIPKHFYRCAVWLDKNAERYLLVVTYFYVTFIIVMGVFNRFVLQATSGWETETALLLFIWLSWIGASLSIRRRTHIRIDFIYQYVSDRVEGLLYIFSDLAVIVFCVLSFDAFVPVLQASLEFGSSLVTLQLNTAFFQVAVPVGLTLMVIRAIQMMILDLHAVLKGKAVYQGEPLFDIDEEGVA